MVNGMEDRIEEVEISDYYEVAQEESTGESTLRWMLKAGLSLGKKAVITGVVVSSVPVVLPPMVVISALGLAFSVPSGIVLASYIGTEKLMRKLLLPPRPVGLEYEAPLVFPGKVQEMGAIVRMEDEGKGYSEMAIKLVDDNADDYGVRGDIWDEAVSVAVEESVDDGQGEEREEVLLEVEVGVGGVFVQEWGEEDETLLEARGDDGPPMLDEDEKVVTGMDEMEGVPECTSVEVKRNATVLEEETEGKKMQDGKTSVKGSGRRGRNNTSAGQNLPRKRGRSEGDKENGGLPGRVEDLFEKSKATSEGGEGPEGVALGTSGDGSGKVSGLLEKEEKPLGLKEMPHAVGQEMGSYKVGDGVSLSSEQGNDVVVGEGLMMSKKEGNVGMSLEKEQGFVGLEEAVKGEGVKDAAISDVNLKMNEEASQSVVVVASETVESVSASDKVAETYSQVTVVASDGEYSVEMAAVTITPKLEREAEIPALQGEEDATAASSNSHFTEAARRDEDIWKKIDAVREIVGYKAPRRDSYFEELKALYLFTGIEPPSASIDSSRLPEFYNKLSLLMSVIGLK